MPRPPFSFFSFPVHLSHNSNTHTLSLYEMSQFRKISTQVTQTNDDATTRRGNTLYFTVEYNTLPPRLVYSPRAPLTRVRHIPLGSTARRKAACTCPNASLAAGSEHLSGCSRSASSLYLLRSSSSDLQREPPPVSRGPLPAPGHAVAGARAAREEAPPLCRERRAAARSPPARPRSAPPARAPR